MMHRFAKTYSDAIFMDATYKTNRHDMALTLISGVSNEGRNIVLCVAFLARETAENYTWLLQNYVEFMEGQEPGTLITDFDSSMCNAIERVFKKTTHLLC